MGEHSPPPAKRGRLATGDLSELSKDELIKKYQRQQEYIEQLEAKVNCAGGDENDDKDKNPVSESSRRENILVMRLANKEQEVQEYAAQITHIKKAQEDAAILSLRQANLDPGVNLLFGKMREELQQTKDKLEQAQSELSAWKFTPDSQNGKKLISRCRTLIAENQELGRQLSQGKSAQLEAELALQKKYGEELKASQDELNEFVIQLDEEVEGMQSTIQVLQQQLAAAKRESENYKKVIDQYESGLPVNKENNSEPNVYRENMKTESDYNGNTQSVSRRRTTSSDSENEFDVRSDRGEAGYNVDKYAGASGRSYSHGVNQDIGGTYSNTAIASPGTPTTEFMGRGVTNAERSPGTPTQEENMDYMDEESDSWGKDRAGDAWDDRTNSTSEEAADLDAEQEEISLTSDAAQDESDDIKALISSATPPLNHDEDAEKNSDKSPHDITNNVRENCGNKLGGVVPATEPNLVAQTNARDKSSSKVTNENKVNVTNNQVAEMIRTAESLTKAGPPATDQAAMMAAYYKNILAQQMVMPDGKIVFPPQLAALGANLPLAPTTLSNDNKSSGTEHQPYQMQPHEFLAQQNALLAAASAGQLMMQGAFTSRVTSNNESVTKTCTASVLNNHTVGVISQNGIDEKTIREKSE